MDSADLISKARPQSILALDSGVGGLTICSAIAAARPDLHINYFADAAAYPYGLLDEAQLERRLEHIVRAVLPEMQPSLLVVACNTASTFVLPMLRTQFNIPVVGVVPAIKPAARLSHTKSIALLATPGTVGRPYLDDLILNHASECHVLRIGSHQLVALAEQKLKGEAVDLATLRCVVQPIIDYNQLAISRGAKSPQAGRQQIDTVILGCTHFPLLQAELRCVLPDMHWVDSSQAIARRVDSLLPQRMDHTAGLDMWYSGGPLPEKGHLAPALSHLGLALKGIGLREIPLVESG